ncbi:MAG: alpha-1,4-glucan--maltose-1-phosphate maltosyltransferase [Chloroflexota bacterium]
MTTPARKPASSRKPAVANAPAAPQTTTRKRSRAAGSSNGAAPGESAPVSYRSVIIESVTPELDGGRYPVKRQVGSTFVVEADIFKEGHDVLAGRVLYQAPGDVTWHVAPLTFVDNDRWRATFTLDTVGIYRYVIEAYPDQYRSWASDTRKKVDAGQDVTSELLEGARLLEQLAAFGTEGDRSTLLDAAKTVGNTAALSAALRLALDPILTDFAGSHVNPALVTRYDRELEIKVDRVRACFGTWYEIFPRSQGTDPTRSATFREAEARIPAIAAMGFDVLYMTPIHPIGTTNRKGPNNTLVAGPNDPGSPYAIGAATGGHTAIEPVLGNLDDFAHFEQTAKAHGMELAMDFAIQASPDHPWVKEHPEWFYHRPDGTIKFAENPPKKYEDIYPLNFQCEAWRELWAELRDVVLFWVRRGVRIFRVDNPHTKPLDFWKWMIREVQREAPDTIFLAEAFTRPKVMKALAKAGFTQSYTYFTWRNERREIEEYLTEITTPPVSEYFRGNLFINTPDILPDVLQHGGRPAFIMRLILAATVGSTYGIYSGYELCENTPREPGSEYYLDSEMYQHKVWDWDRPGNIIDIVTLVNKIRHENPALQLYDNLRFYGSEDEHILFYGKATPDNENIILVALNLSTSETRHGGVFLPPGEFGIRDDEVYEVDDLLTGATYSWYGRHNWVRLDPQTQPAHILQLRRLGQSASGAATTV